MAKVVTIPANAVKQEIDLELNKPSERQRVHAIQYDNNKAYIVATVWNNGEQYKLTTDDTIAFVCTKPDGHGINKEAFIDNEGRIIFPIGEQLTVVYGEFPAEFRIFSVTYDDDGKIIPVSKATTSFMVWIEKSSLQNNTVISSDDFDTLTKLITEATEVIANANIAIDNAITATSNATDATHEAIVATNNANTAAANANTATVNANNAADRANEAASNAEIATVDAIEATVNANNAADRANRAAQDAEDVVAGTGIVMESQKGQPNGVASLDETGKIPLTQIPDGIGGGSTAEDITYGEITVKDALDDHASQLASTVKKVNGQLPDATGNVAIEIPTPDLTPYATKIEVGLKADKTYVDTITQSIASGSPKGVYATVADLNNAFPAGDTNIYLVTADGNWYYWNGTAWTAGGLYLDSSGQQLPPDAIVYEVPTAKNEFVGNKFIKRVAKEVFDGNRSYVSFSTAYDNVYRVTLAGWASEVNALQSVYDSGIATSDDGDYPIVDSASYPMRSISIGAHNKNGSLYISVERAKIDAMPSGASLAGFKEYLNLHPITLLYQLNNDEIIDLPSDLSANSKEIVRLSSRSNEQEINLTKLNSVLEPEGVIKRMPYFASLVFIGDNLWAFNSSDDAHTLFDDINIYDHNFNLIKTLKHNFGHVNSMSYNTESKALIFGNGSSDGSQEDGYIHIIQNVEHWLELPNNTQLNMITGIPGSNVTSIFVGKRDEFGYKVNACWGELNAGQGNICYVLSSDNTKIRKFLLGQGTNQFENGTFISGKTDKEFNGTYKILQEWLDIPRLEVNQDCIYYNGYLYIALGHNGIWHAKYKLNTDGTVDIVQKLEPHYNPDGTLKVETGEGIAIKNNTLFYGLKTGGANWLYKSAIF